MEQFRNRQEAGRDLALSLKTYADRPDAIVLALPRGGVPVAYEIAKALHLPLDVFLVRKLGLPGHEELAMGAIASGGVQALNEAVISMHPISKEAMHSVIQAELHEMERREKKYRRGCPPLNIKNNVVILVDDGIATGATMKVAIQALRLKEPLAIVVAVPVVPHEIYVEMQRYVEKIVAPLTPETFFAVGAFYETFEQTSDEEVLACLGR